MFMIFQELFESKSFNFAYKLGEHSDEVDRDTYMKIYGENVQKIKFVQSDYPSPHWSGRLDLQVVPW